MRAWVLKTFNKLFWSDVGWIVVERNAKPFYQRQEFGGMSEMYYWMYDSWLLEYGVVLSLRLYLLSVSIVLYREIILSLGFPNCTEPRLCLLLLPHSPLLLI